MLKILKKLKPYTLLIILNVILVSTVSVLMLLLPDKMSNIINYGIKEEIVYEKTQDGKDVYVDLSLFGQMAGNTELTEIRLPAVKYKDAGYLVTYEKNGKQYAKIDFNDPLEKNAAGEPVTMTSMNASGQITTVPVPKFIRTADGNALSERKQGTLILQDNGMAQINMKTVTVMKEIWKNGLIMILITIVSSLCNVGASFLGSRIGVGFGRDIRRDIFKKVIYFSAEESDKFGTSSLITRATNDVSQLQNLVIMSLRMMVMVPAMMTGGLILAIKKSADMSLVLVAIIPIIVLVMIFVFVKILPLFKSIQKKTDRLTLVARESITGVRVIRAFGADEKENKRFDEANLDVSMTGYKAAKYMSILMPFMMFLLSVTSLAIVLIGVNYVDGALKSASFGMSTVTTLGNMMAVIQYIMHVMFSVLMFAMIFIMVPRASVSAIRISEILDSESPLKEKDASEKETDQRGTVVFDNVSFSYGKAEKSVLDSISFAARPGEITAIIGSTGSGKSTLINLIPRLYDVTDGKVTVDGVDVRDYKLSDLRSKISFVTQKATLFSGTIEENLSFGKPDATEEEIRSAAEIAKAKNFIEEKENGFRADVEHGAANFSGGQKQRLSIARAIARRPEIYVFDDSFSALDFKTDAELRAGLKNEIKDSTVFIVAQRIGTVMDADRIIVLAEGKIAGIGKHADLLKNCGVYKEIALSQLSERELGLSAEA